LVISTTTNGSVVDNGDGTVTYTHDGSETVNDSFTYTIDDASGLTSNSATVSITVTPQNDVPVITGDDSCSLIEDNDYDGDGLLEFTGLLTINDPDAGESSFVAETIVGSYGELVIDSSGNWTYRADNGQSAIQNLDTGQSLTEVFQVTSADATVHSLDVLILGTDEAIIPGDSSNTGDGGGDADGGDEGAAPGGGNTPGATGEQPPEDSGPPLDPENDDDILPETDQDDDDDSTEVTPDDLEDEDGATTTTVATNDSSDPPEGTSVAASEEPIVEEPLLDYTNSVQSLNVGPSHTITAEFVEDRNSESTRGNLQPIRKSHLMKMLSQGLKVAGDGVFDFIAPPLAANPVFLNVNDADLDIPLAENKPMQSHLAVMEDEIERAYEESKTTNKVIVYVTSGVSASLTAGVATYLLRAGSLMTSFLATVPIWKGFDPIAILTMPKKKKAKQDKVVTPPEFSGDKPAERMFDGGGS